MRIAGVGHAVFAATMIVFGIISLIDNHIAAAWPKGMPASQVLNYFNAIIFLVCGAGLLWPRTAALAARTLLTYLLIWTLLVKVRLIVLHPLVEGPYQSWGESAVIVAAAWVLYAWFATDRDRKYLGFAVGASGVRIARMFYGLALIAFGLSHFVYLNLTAPLIPGWLPWHVFWAYFTGTAYLAAGAAILSGVIARLAAALSTVQMGSFIFLVWLPIALAGKMTAFNWGELVVTCLLTAAAWVVADSYRDVPWFGMNTRSRPRAEMTPDAGQS